MKRAGIILAGLLLGFVSSQVWANSTFDLSLEELMKIEVTSVSKRPQKLRSIPAAVHVISEDDIRRSGATSIPEVLRLAPGVQVLAVANNRWSISIRGGAREYANKLQVLVDGRSVYSPTFSGVMWEALEVPLENIKQIEIIRGPGAALWGSNAVNGVINIITRTAFETQNTLLRLGGGNELEKSAFVRHGWKRGEDTAVRVYARGFEYGESHRVNGPREDDYWRNRSAGFRLDRGTDENAEKFMLQGNAYYSRAGSRDAPSALTPFASVANHNQKIDGFNLSAKWDLPQNNGNYRSWQTSFEHSRLDHLLLDEKRATFDLEFTERLSPRRRHNIIWGLGTRLSWDTIENSNYLTFRDRKSTTPIYRAFLNDDIILKEDILLMTVSVGLEHNKYTGLEFQPSLRFMYTPDSDDSIWASFARSVRTPSRLENGVTFIDRANILPVPLMLQTEFDGVITEKLKSMEIGWRRQVNSDFSFDIAGFYFKYDDAVSSGQTFAGLVAPGVLLSRYHLNNNTKADFRGGELVLDWRANKKLQLQGIFSYININTAQPAGTVSGDIDDNVPEKIITLFSKYDFSKALAWNLWIRKTGEIDKKMIRGYTTVDSSLSWKASERLNISLVGQNVFDKKHQEFQPVLTATIPREFGRKVYLQADWSF